MSGVRGHLDWLLALALRGDLLQGSVRRTNRRAAMQVLGFQDYEPQARRVAKSLNASFRLVQVHYFPDGESRVTLPDKLERELLVVRTMDHPNDKLVELLLLASTARDMGVERLSLVAPYLCYMRQDAAFYVGEAISQQVVGAFLATLFDDIVTVDPHLHRTTDLAVALPGCNSVSLAAAGTLADFLIDNPDPNRVLVGPDAESRQWVESLAQRAGHPFAIASKERFGDHEVKVAVPEFDLRGRNVLLVDDVVSTGRTLADAAQGVLQMGAARVDAMVTHPLLAGHSEQVLERAGIKSIFSTDSITHMSNTVRLAPLIADGVRSLLKDTT
jgi:ribose-phosphate pyrophosphokinase